MAIRPTTRIPILSFPLAPPDPNRLADWANAITDTINRGLTQQAEAFVPRDQFVKKPTNQIRTNTSTTAPDSDLTVGLVANGTYVIEGHIWYETSDVADFKFTFSGPAAPSRVRIFHEALAPAAAAYSNIGLDAAFGVAQSVLAASGTSGYVHFVANILNGLNAGLFSFDWAQNTPDALTNTTVLSGSYLTFNQL